MVLRFRTRIETISKLLWGFADKENIMININKTIIFTGSIDLEPAIYEIKNRFDALITLVDGKHHIYVKKDIFNVFINSDLISKVEDVIDRYPDKAIFVWDKCKKKFVYCHFDAPDGECQNCNKLLFRNQEAIAEIDRKIYCEECYYKLK